MQFVAVVRWLLVVAVAGRLLVVAVARWLLVAPAARGCCCWFLLHSNHETKGNEITNGRSFHAMTSLADNRFGHSQHRE